MAAREGDARVELRGVGGGERVLVLGEGARVAGGLAEEIVAVLVALARGEDEGVAEEPGDLAADDLHAEELRALDRRPVFAHLRERSGAVGLLEMGEDTDEQIPEVLGVPAALRPALEGVGGLAARLGGAVVGEVDAGHAEGAERRLVVEGAELLRLVQAGGGGGRAPPCRPSW